MRTYGALNPTDQIPLVADTVGSVNVSSAAAVVAQDWPTGAQLVYFNSAIDFWVNFGSTSVSIPSASTAGSTAAASANILNPGIRQIPGGSTGYSITAGAAGVVSAEFWKK